MSADLKKTFCVFPFIQTVIRTSGSLGPCCRIQSDSEVYNIYNTSIENFWQSDDLNSLRKNIISGVADSRCSVCHNEELQFNKSMRTGSLADYKFYDSKYYLALLSKYNLQNSNFPKRIELHLGNLCNLKCLTCRPEDSSALLAENQALKISEHRQKDYQLSEEVVNNILMLAIKHNIELLDLRGGETMLMPIIKEMLLNWPQEQSENLTIRIQTNCTILDDDWKKIFKKFKKFEIMLSIDGFGEDNEYIRYPSKWNVIEQNVSFLTSLPNAKTYVNCSVSNLNFLLLPRLIDWCKDRGIFFHCTAITFPAEFKYTNLPTKVFEKAKEELKMYPEIQPLLTQLADQTQWDNFCNLINIRDKYRKNRIFDILPQLKNYWKE